MSIVIKRIYYGWWITLAAGAIEFANAGTAISILTIFVIPMSEEFGWSRTEISVAASLGAVLGAGLAPFTGRLVDRAESRLVLVIGGMIVTISCFFLAITETLLGFYFAFVCSRLADQGLIKIGASPTVGKWFLRYRGRAVALVFFAGAAGIIVMAPMVQLVISSWSWRAAWVMLALVMFFIGVVPSAILVRRQPEDLGLKVDGDPPIAELQYHRSDLSRSERPPPVLEEHWLLGEVLCTPTFWLVVFSLFAVSIGISGVGLHLIPHLTQQGLGEATAVGAISVMFTAGAAGALTLGFLSEHISPRLILGSIYLLLATSTGILIVADNIPQVYLFAVLNGIAGSGVNTLSPILWARYYGRATLGSIYGITRAAQVTGLAMGPLLSGILFDTTGAYYDAFLIFAMLALGSSLLILVARTPVKMQDKGG